MTMTDETVIQYKDCNYIIAVPEDKKCYFCKDRAERVIATDIFFGCEKHIDKAKQLTREALCYIGRHGIHKWLNKGNKQ